MTRKYSVATAPAKVSKPKAPPTSEQIAAWRRDRPTYGNVATVGEAFYAGPDSGRDKATGPDRCGQYSHTFFTEDGRRTAWSYGHHYLAAIWTTIRSKSGKPQPFALVNGDKATVSTSGHINTLRHALDSERDGRTPKPYATFSATALCAALGLDIRGQYRLAECINSGRVSVLDFTADERISAQDAGDDPDKFTYEPLRPGLNRGTGWDVRPPKEPGGYWYAHRPAQVLFHVKPDPERPHMGTVDRYLFAGMDEGSYFVVELPGKATTIRAALDILKPELVRRIDAGKVPGATYTRQGEWFFIHGLDTGRPEHWRKMGKPLAGGRMVPLPSLDIRSDVRRNDHIVTELRYGNWPTKTQGRNFPAGANGFAIYARGYVRHRGPDGKATGQHGKVKLDAPALCLASPGVLSWGPQGFVD